MKRIIHFLLFVLLLALIAITLVIIFDCGIPCSLPTSQIERINNVLISLCTSGICCILFYYILTYSFEQITIHSALERVYPELRLIATRMEVFISYLAIENSIEVKKEDIMYEHIEFQESITVDFEPANDLPYQFHVRKDEFTLEPIKFGYNIANIKYQKREIQSTIDKILLYDGIVNNEKLSNILIQIRGNSLFDGVDYGEREKEIDPERGMAFTAGCVPAYHKLYKELLHYARPSIFVVVSKKEKE